MKIKNRRHWSEEQCEVIHEIFHEMEKLAEESEHIFNDARMSMEFKCEILNYRQTEIASLSNLINNVLDYEVRNDNGMLYTSELFNKVFYFRQAAEIEAGKEEKENEK